MGLGDLSARSFDGLMTIGSGRFAEESRPLALRSYKSTSDVVGAIDVRSFELSLLPRDAPLWWDDSRLGFGGAAGLFVAFVCDRAFIVLFLDAIAGLGALAAANEAAVCEGDLA